MRALAFMALLAPLAACGADGAPVRPELDTSLGARAGGGTAGVSAGVGVTLRRAGPAETR